MNERGKSDSPVVPAKPSNKAGLPVAEVVEERGLAKRNTNSTTRPGRSAGQDVSSGLDRVREVARRDKDAQFTALLHHVDIDRLRVAYPNFRQISLSCTGIWSIPAYPIYICAGE